MDDFEFFAGAMMSLTALVGLVLAGAFSLSLKRNPRLLLLSPALMFLVPYVAFLSLSFARPLFPIEYVPGIQSNVYFSWSPSLATTGLYMLGGLAFFAGYAAFPATSREFGVLWRATVGAPFEWIRSLIRSRKLQYYLISLFILWAIGLSANLLIFLQIQGFPLIDRSKRLGIDPKIVFLTELQPLLVLAAPYAFRLQSAVPSRFRLVLRPSVYAGLCSASLAALALLGARNLPAKLGLALGLCVFLAVPRQRAELRRYAKVVVALAFVLFVLGGVVGAFTKVEIYRFSLSQLPGTVIGAPIADSVGNLYSLEVLANYSGTYGRFGGNLLWSTFLSYVPGRDELYANYIVGQVLGYRPDQLRSISSTFNGPAILDLGILGMIVNSLLYGYALSYGWRAFKECPRNLGAVSLFLATALINITLGTYNLWAFFSFIVLVACVEYNRVF